MPVLWPFARVQKPAESDLAKLKRIAGYFPRLRDRVEGLIYNVQGSGSQAEEEHNRLLNPSDRLIYSYIESADT